MSISSHSFDVVVAGCGIAGLSAAVAAGYADCVVVFRALAQGQFQRFGAAPPAATASGEAALTFPATSVARTQ